MLVRYAATISAMLLACSSLACDRLSGSSVDDGAQAQFTDQIEAHGPPPTADDGVTLDGSRRLAVLTPNETRVAGKTLSKNPTVMEVARLMKGSKQKDAGWLVWPDRSVTVRRLARFVQKLEMAGDDPAVDMAVDVSSGDADPDIRGVRLAPASTRELAASNAWAVHAPQKTKVTGFLEKLRQRRRSKGEQLEEFSE